MRFLPGASISGSAYSPLQKLLHWSVVGLVVLQVWSSGGIERSHADHLAGTEPSRFDLVLHQLHTYAGLLVGLLVALRILLRLQNGAPVPDVSPHPALRLAARINHLAMYVVLLALPITGVGARYIDFQEIGPVHVFLTRALLVLVMLHVVATLWHLARGDGVVSRMLPDSSAFGPGRTILVHTSGDGSDEQTRE